MFVANRIEKIYQTLSIGEGIYYKIKIAFLYFILSFKNIFGLQPSFKKEHYVSIRTDKTKLPFFIKDQLDFDVLWDSMFEDQYHLADLEKGEFRDGVEVIFDLGTNIGTAALKFYQKFPKALIYCFEPDPYNFKRLEKNVSLVDEPRRIKLFNYAISDSDKGRVSFYRGKNNHWSSSLLKRKGTDEEVLVKTITLDTFCSTNDIDRVDIVKMDIEGAETDAMEGFKDKLNSVSYFIGEIHPGVMKDSIFDFLSRFDSFDIDYLNTDTGVFKFKKIHNTK